MPDLNPTQVQLQSYQGQADTAFPYYNLAANFQPLYGQLGLGLQQQQQFGYNTGTGQPLSPYGGYVGMPDGQGGYIGMTSPYGTGPYPYQAGAMTSGGAPTQAGWMTSAGGGAPAMGPTQVGGSPTATTPPGAPQLAVAGQTPIGGAPVSSAPGGTPFVGYSPPQGSRIGFGETFNNPYANQVGPSQAAGSHPGTLSLNTTAMDAYGPAAAQGILSANPYLANALDFQTLAQMDASNPLQNSAILNTLNQQAQNQLAAGGRLTPEQERANQQAALSAFSNAGAGTTGNQAIAAQLFGRQNMIDQRLAAAQQLGQNVQGLNFSQQGQELQRQQIAGNMASQAASSAATGLTSPIMNMLGLIQPSSVSDPNSTISAQNSINNPYQQAGLQIASANYNADIAKQIADQNQSAATTSGYLALGGAALNAFSDERLKKNLKEVGKSDSGIPEFEWTYKYDPYKKRYHGTTAQALEKVRPEAVITDPTSGIKLVDYSKTDVSFHQLNPYLQKAA